MFRLLRLPLFLVLSSTTLLAQNAVDGSDIALRVPPKSPPNVTLTGTIHGTIFCSDTRRPARGALVLLQPMTDAVDKPEADTGSKMTRTLIDGTYSFAHVTEGEYAVVAFLPGYTTPLDDLVIDDDNVNSETAMEKKMAEAGTIIVHRKQSSTHDITLQRGASISGRILYSDGSPAAQVSLEIQNIKAKPSKNSDSASDYGAMMRRMFTQESTSTDDQGRYRISGLRAGSYRVAAVQMSAGDHSCASGVEDSMTEAMIAGLEPNPDALRIYSGDTLHRADAKTYELLSGDNVTGVDILIPLSAFHKVRGSIVATDGRIINAAKLTLTDTDDGTIKFASAAGPDGVFIFSAVPVGTYKLNVTDGIIATTVPGNDPTSRVTNMFADADSSVVVKDNDVEGITVALTEVSMPAKLGAQNPPPGMK